MTVITENIILPLTPSQKISGICIYSDEAYLNLLTFRTINLWYNLDEYSKASHFLNEAFRKK